jgi:hypothetical protein
MLPQGSEIERQEENPFGLTSGEEASSAPTVGRAFPEQKRGTRATKHNGAAFLP